MSFSIASLNLLGTHPLARALYNIVIIGLLLELHCGFDFPWALHNLVPFGLMHGPPGHEIHHKRGKVNYAKFFSYLDWLCGTAARVKQL